MIRQLLHSRADSATPAWVAAVQAQRVQFHSLVQALAATSSRDIHRDLEGLLVELMYVGNEEVAVALVVAYAHQRFCCQVATQCALPLLAWFVPEHHSNGSSTASDDMSLCRVLRIILAISATPTGCAALATAGATSPALSNIQNGSLHLVKRQAC